MTDVTAAHLAVTSCYPYPERHFIPLVLLSTVFFLYCYLATCFRRYRDVYYVAAVVGVRVSLPIYLFRLYCFIHISLPVVSSFCRVYDFYCVLTVVL